MDQDAIPPGALDAIARTPWVIQVIAVVFVIGVILQAAPQLLGNYQSVIRKWTDGRRRTRLDKSDAIQETLTRQNHGLEERLDDVLNELHAMRDYQRRHEEILAEHAIWDRAVRYALIDMGGHPPPRPPLWPPDEDDDTDPVATGHGTA